MVGQRLPPLGTSHHGVKNDQVKPNKGRADLNCILNCFHPWSMCPEAQESNKTERLRGLQCPFEQISSHFHCVLIILVTVTPNDPD